MKCESCPRISTGPVCPACQRDNLIGQTLQRRIELRPHYEAEIVTETVQTSCDMVFIPE